MTTEGAWVGVTRDTQTTTKTVLRVHNHFDKPVKFLRTCTPVISMVCEASRQRFCDTTYFDVYKVRLMLMMPACCCQRCLHVRYMYRCHNAALLTPLHYRSCVAVAVAWKPSCTLLVVQQYRGTCNHCYSTVYKYTTSYGLHLREFDV